MKNDMTLEDFLRLLRQFIERELRHHPRTRLPVRKRRFLSTEEFTLLSERLRAGEINEWQRAKVLAKAFEISVHHAWRTMKRLEEGRGD